MESAVIIRVKLPDRLDQLRQRCVDDAVRGVPGHVTLLYPFLSPVDLGDDARTTIESIASSHEPFRFVLSGPERWPDTIYASVQPGRPFLAIHRDLASAFPDYPIYRRPGFELVPHVTIAEGKCVDQRSVPEDPSWTDLPVDGMAETLEVIAEGDDGHWRTVWTMSLGSRGP